MKDPEDRLGHEGGAAEILRHEWFSDIDIAAIQDQTLETPGFKPPAFSIEALDKYFNLKTGSKNLNESFVNEQQIRLIEAEEHLFA